VADLLMVTANPILLGYVLGFDKVNFSIVSINKVQGIVDLRRL
jgi:hypothetical protein